MIIRGASLINRFYSRDGWTRETVAELLSSPENPANKIICVEPRYFSDDPINPAYFAVYHNQRPDLNSIFDRAKIEAHEYQPYMSWSGRSDGGFETKNRWI